MGSGPYRTRDEGVEVEGPSVIRGLCSHEGLKHGNEYNN